MARFLLQINFLFGVMTGLLLAQYYQPPPPPSFNSIDSSLASANSNSDIDTSVEQKYVNSGQSIILICDLPNNMPDGKVIFIKYDNKVLSSGSAIREDSDDERFEIGQQYAWEWSLKINSINEDDSGLYFCKVANTIIKKFEIVVRVPPRIKDDLMPVKKSVREGDSVEFACFASGTPKPNITWYVYSASEQSFKMLPHAGSYLKVDNVNRYTPRRYQCRAFNNIPPSDTRNLTFSVEFAPEIEIQSKLDTSQNSMTLNCTINAYPLTNVNFWRKDGNFILNDLKRQIKNIKVDDSLFVSQLTIKNYNDADQGLYECTAENDLRVSKIVYNLKENYNFLSRQQQQEPVVLMPIGSSNDFRDKSRLIQNDFQALASSTQSSSLLDDAAALGGLEHKIPKQFRTKSGYHFHHQQAKQHQMKNDKLFQSENEDSSSSASILNTYDSNQNRVNKNQRKQHQRNHKNFSRQPSNSNLVEKLVYASRSTKPSPTTNYANSPYIILINDDENVNNNESGPLKSSSSRTLLAEKAENNNSMKVHLTRATFFLNFFFISFSLLSNYLGKFGI